jgi:hypothetical protein
MSNCVCALAFACILSSGENVLERCSGVYFSGVLV